MGTECIARALCSVGHVCAGVLSPQAIEGAISLALVVTGYVLARRAATPTLRASD